MKATSGRWKTKRLPVERVRLKLERAFDAAEWEAIQLGFIPEEMEDKWFIYEEGGWLNFHRSWTGFCVYRVRLQPTPVGSELAEAWVNRDKEQYTCADDAYDAQLLSWLIDVLLLKRPAPWPESGKGDEAMRQWSFVGRAMFAHGEDGNTTKELEKEIEGGGKTRRPGKSPA